MLAPRTLGPVHLISRALVAIAIAGMIACSSDDEEVDDQSEAVATTEPTAGAVVDDIYGPGVTMTVAVREGELGSYLTGPDGSALYVFLKDAPDTSNCTGGCLDMWPPLLLAEGASIEAAGASGVFSSIVTAAGTQVTYNSAPLYYFAADGLPGDTKGDGVGGVWSLARP
jgi:predicted lipoprotein with Yx(FWY)xxD motif